MRTVKKVYLIMHKRKRKKFSKKKKNKKLKGVDERKS